MKAATILALLIGTNAIRLSDPGKTHSYPDAARILKLDPNTPFPDYPEGAIKQLDDGLCRSSDCGEKPKKKKVKKVSDFGSDTSKVNASPPVAVESADAKKDSTATNEAGATKEAKSLTK